MIGYQDLLVLLGIGIFFFGAKRLPEISRSLGQALAEFKKGVTQTTPTPGPVEAPPAKPEVVSTTAKDHL